MDRVETVFNVSDLMGDLSQVKPGQKIVLIKTIRTHFGNGGRGLDLLQAKNLVDEFSRVLSTSTESAEKLKDLEDDKKRLISELATLNAQMRSIRALVAPIMGMVEGHF